MVFEKSYNSIFESEDEFGLNNYRQDFYSIFNMNKIKVRLIKPDLTEQQLKNDFLGVRNNNSSVNFSVIEVCIQSSSPQQKPMTEEGYNSQGELTYTCFTPFDVDISGKHTIEFIENYDLFGIRKGQQFRITASDFGFWKGQYGFKSFEIIAK